MPFGIFKENSFESHCFFPVISVFRINLINRAEAYWFSASECNTFKGRTPAYKKMDAPMIQQQF